MKYRIVKIDHGFHIVRDLMVDPPYSEVDPGQPVFMTMDAAEKWRQTLEDEWMASLAPRHHEKAKAQRP